MTRVALKVRVFSVRLTTIQSTNIKPKKAECKTITTVQWFCRYTRIDCITFYLSDFIRDPYRLVLISVIRPMN